VSAFLLHGKKDESHWKFAAKMTLANSGFISPLEALTNETPDLSDLIVPFSPSYVTQAVTGSLSTHAREGFFCGCPEYTTPGVWEHYFPDTKSLQTSRHAVFDEHKHFIDHGDPDTRARHALELSTKIAALEARSAPPTNGKKPVPSILKEALAQDHYLVCNAAVIDRATCYIRDRNVEHHGKRISESIGTKYKKGTSKKTFTPNDCAYDLRCMWSTTSAVCPSPYVRSAPPIAYNRLLAVVAPFSHGPISSADQAALEVISTRSSTRQASLLLRHHSRRCPLSTATLR
jgi:hypothetical protein